MSWLTALRHYSGQPRDLATRPRLHPSTQVKQYAWITSGSQFRSQNLGDGVRSAAWLKALAKLREDKRVKTTGEKRATTYAAA